MEKNITVITPTLNAEKYLNLCLNSLKKQTGLKNIEILIADGGSSDNTLEICKKYKTKVFQNKLKTSESGKMLCLKEASYDFIAFIDSDNILKDNFFFSKALDIFNRYNVDAVEPIGFEFLKNDSDINKYCSLMGLNDPFEFYMKRFDKMNVIINDFTFSNYTQIFDDIDMKIVKFTKPSLLPSFGANGFIIKKNDLHGVLSINKEMFYFDTDIPIKIYNKKKSFIIGKLKSNLIHYYCRSDKEFIKKQDRRIKDFLYYNKARSREKINIKKTELLSILIKSITVIPIIIDSIKLKNRSKDQLKLLTHIKYFYITFIIYSINVIKFIFTGGKTKIKSRNNW